MENLQDIELRRVEINKKLKIIIAILTPISLIIGFLALYYTEDLGLAIILALWVFIFFYIFFRALILGSFEDDFKDKVISALVYQIDPNLQYRKKNYISYDDFNFANLYSDNYDVYRGNDLIEGEIDGVKIKFSDVCMQKEDNRGNSKYMVNIFYGIFFVADFSKNFNSFTIIIDKKSSKASTYLQRAHMDDSEFERIFNVYTQDQIEARYLLAPAFMEKFIQMRIFFNCPVNAVFSENKIYLYIERGVDSFEVSFKKPLTGESSAISWYKSEIESFIDLIQVLNLDSKIFKIK